MDARAATTYDGVRLERPPGRSGEGEEVSDVTDGR
jgi:hypothetical protein